MSEVEVLKPLPTYPHV